MADAPAPVERALERAARLHAAGQLVQAAEAYREAMAEGTDCVSALLGLSLIARQAGQLPAAVALAGKAVSASPSSAAAWGQLGHALFARGQMPQADAAYRRAIALSPADARGWVSLGEFLTATKRAQEGGRCFEHALKIDPKSAPAHYGMGNGFALREDFHAAMQWFERALELNPGHPESHFAVAFCRARMGETSAAIQGYVRAVTIRPGFASAWLNLGVALVADGRDQLAELCYRQALQADPKLFSAHLNLGNLARSWRLFAQARMHYARAMAIACAPAQRSAIQESEAHVGLAYLHLEQGEFSLAWQCLEQASTANPRNAEVANARGVLLLAEVAEKFDEGKIMAAIDAFREAEQQGHKTAASNRGNALLRLGRVAEALAAHAAAVACDPHHPGARYNLALTQLRAGNFSDGWRNYEIRWSFREVHPRPRRWKQPRWHGEAAEAGQGSMLLLYCEQGLGDTVQFVRYLPQVMRLGWRVVLEVQPALTRLLRQLADSLGVTVVSQGSALPAFGKHCPLLSLPAVFQVTLESMGDGTGAFVPYLEADASLAAEKARELESGKADERRGRASVTGMPQRPEGASRALRIGIAWAGNPKYRADHERSTGLETLLPLLHIGGVEWVSLQKGESASKIAALPGGVTLRDMSSADRDLADTAATIANLDLVISTDTVIAHLAGAMGKPLWLLLPWQSDWRWMQKRLDTPWYPQARLFRQRAHGDWPELIGRVGEALQREFLQRPWEPKAL